MSTIRRLPKSVFSAVFVAALLHFQSQMPCWGATGAGLRTWAGDGNDGVDVGRQWSDGRHSGPPSCRNNPDICRDPDKNPGGGATCCWNRVCKDTERDDLHCGSCGHFCFFGTHCCGGECVNLLFDNFNCGVCGHRCVPPSRCAFGMCGYAAAADS
ncbi:hypothetical protein KP509_19G008200 [Ceratopteris richardii]|uniref:Stigma-specific Stig1 family protein n=1 Tax=Ceratopteris richardii TaxID=49495 RepID=A0A8T2SJW6_CERRI|nr:hypothetical protein KP509_19G008200 [Ceratopteris richardii]